MSVISTVVFIGVLSSCLGLDVEFPYWFQFGTSTASYQVEGAWNVSDKSESIWDRFTHEDPTVILDLSNGDVACNSYNLWKRDVEMASELGLDFYRFSISWPRLLPSGFSNYISEDGSKYYSNLIDGLLEKGIEPVVTLYHWDLPQRLQDLGGWTNPFISDWFASYAKVVFSLYADRVKIWITINEPVVVCDHTYSGGTFAPGIVDPEIGVYACNKHLLLAHAKAWRIYDEQFKSLYHGKVSISNHIMWLSPKTAKDTTLAKLARDFHIGRYSYPIYSKKGGWPPSIVKIMKEVSSKEGYEMSRLPEFTDDEIKLVRGTYDFFGLNYYTCRLVRRSKPGETLEGTLFNGIPELNAVFEVEPGQSRENTYAECPEGLREVTNYLKEQYGNLEILITENGQASTGSNLRDTERSEYIRVHLEQILLSIKVDRVNITGYTFWSLMDNFEWTNGYEIKFGLYEVDFTSPQRTRTPRSSAGYYSQIIRSRSLRINSNNTKYFYDRK